MIKVLALLGELFVGPDGEDLHSIGGEVFNAHNKLVNSISIKDVAVLDPADKEGVYFPKT